MGDERYSRGTNPQGDDYNRSETQDYGRDYGSGRSGSYSSAREFEAAGEIGNDARRGYGNRDYGNQRYAQRDRQYGARDDGPGFGGRDAGYRGYGDQGRDAGYRGYGDQGRGGNAGGGQYHGSYASDGRRFEDVGRYRHADDDDYRRTGGNRSYGGQPQGYDYQDRGFFQRAGDEVRSWFGDDDAERRREEDARRDERYDSGNSFGGNGYGADRHRDSDYHGWRSNQIAALDRDYDEYRRENRSKFESEFSSWRTNRQGQRDQLGRVTEHMEVVGSDGEHVGTVDKVRGDRILLTKNDADAGGRHHSIPSSWIGSVEAKLTLTKTAAEAKRQWQDEERNSAMFNYGDNAGRDRSDATRTDANATSTSSAKTY